MGIQYKVQCVCLKAMDRPESASTSRCVRSRKPVNNDMDCDADIEYSARVVFVRNVSIKINQDELAQFFSKFGNVTGVSVRRKKRKYLKLRTGFVAFEDAEAANNARFASTADLILEGSILDVTPAYSKKRKRPGSYRKNKLDATDAGQEPPVNHIDSLTEDALMHIFSYLDIYDLLEIENVSRRWRNVVKRTWAAIRVLNFSNLYSFYDLLLNNNLGSPYLQIYLERCKNLVELNLESVYVHSFENGPHIIARLCPNLEILNLQGMDITNKGLRAIAEGCKYIKHINLSDCCRITEAGLTWLFQICKRLESVNLGALGNFSGKECFHHLGPSVTSLQLSNCSAILSDGFKIAYNNCPYLSELSLQHCRFLIDNVFKDMCQSCTSLTKLDLTAAFRYLTPSGMAYVGLLNKLIDIKLAFNPYLDDDVLRAISNGCQNLRSIDLSGDVSVTDKGIRYLRKCSKLETLIINRTPQVTDVSLRHLAELGSLHIVRAEGNVHVSDAGCIALIIFNPNLVELNVNGCKTVTSATLEAALNAVKFSPRRKGILEVSVKGTSVKQLAPNLQHPLLKISVTEYESDFVGEFRGLFADQD